LISKIHIKNFQSHKDTSLELSPGVNVIVGTSDCGKTAVIRALKWLMWNKPSGDDFRSDWGGDTQVTIEVDGHTIIRGKGKENIYQLNNKLFKAFGTDVPEEIQTILNIDETNIQQQLDSPFLISDSPGEVASYFNKIAGLDKIDSSTKYIQSQIRSYKGKIESDEAQAKEYEQDLKQYEYLDKFEVDLEFVESMYEEFLIRTKGKNTLLGIINQIKEINKEKKQYEWIIHIQKQVDETLTLYGERDSTFDKLYKIKELVEEIHKVDYDITYLKRTIKLQIPVNKLLDDFQKKEDKKARVETLRNLVASIMLTIKAWHDGEKALKEMEELFHKEMPDICPLCGTKTEKQ